MDRRSCCSAGGQRQMRMGPADMPDCPCHLDGAHLSVGREERGILPLCRFAAYESPLSLALRLVVM